MKKYKISENTILLEEEEAVEYNMDRDFITLECWKKTREVKLFFYNEGLQLIEIAKRTLNGYIKFVKNQKQNLKAK
ncbi:MAG: hypothetical protein ABII90_00710 [Bacteroidota bacterium]